MDENGLVILRLTLSMRWSPKELVHVQVPWSAFDNYFNHDQNFQLFVPGTWCTGWYELYHDELNEVSREACRVRLSKVS